MARIQLNSWLNTWADGDNPGAGSQSADSNGLNGQWVKIDTFAQAEHNTNGTHKNDIIDGKNIKASAFDGSSLETNNATGTKVARIKAGGVQGTMLNANVVDASSLQLSSNQLSIKAAGVQGSHLNGNVVDNSTLALSSNQLIVKDGGLTQGKFAAGDIARVVPIVFQVVGASVYCGGPTSIASSHGLSLGQDMNVIAISAANDSGEMTMYYSNANKVHFAYMDAVNVAYVGASHSVMLYKNGSVTSFGVGIDSYLGHGVGSWMEIVVWCEVNGYGSSQ